MEGGRAESRGRLKASVSCLGKREILRRKFAPEKGYQGGKVHSVSRDTLVQLRFYCSKV